MMRITGYALREVLRNLSTQREIAATEFADALWSFDSNSDSSRTERLGLRCEKLDAQIAAIQELQARYNLSVKVSVPSLRDDGAEIQVSLLLIVKALDGLGKRAKMWVSATKDTGRDRYDSYRTRMEEGEIRAKKTMSQESLHRLAQRMQRLQSAYRSALARGNATEVNFEDVPPDLLEV
jgi:hypothetical protein